MTRRVGSALAFGVAVEVLFRPPASLVVFGAVTGALYGLAAAGVVLVYRSHRVLNFAAIALGSLPVVAMTLLEVLHGLSYWVALPASVAGGALLGALVEVVVVRRFARISRLLLTVALLAVVQVLALVNERVAARLVSDRSIPSRVNTPFRSLSWVDGRGAPIITGDQIAALVAVAIAVSTVWWFLYRTRVGVATRAAAENLDRASALAVPVHRLHVGIWAAAGAIGAITVFFHVPLVGVPIDPTLGPTVTLFVVAAAIVARLDSIAGAFGAGIAIGILEQASVAKVGSAHMSSLLVLAFVLIALLARRASPEDDVARREHDAWTATADPPRLSRAVSQLPRVRVARGALGAVVALATLAAPFAVSAGQLGKLTLIPLTAIVALSLVVLTGWGGQVSLGQFAFAGVGAGISGGLAANHNVDFFISLAVGVGAGAVVAVVIGLPAARLRGMYLAVTTLALAAAMQSYVLQRQYVVHRLLLPHGEAPRIERPALYGVVDLTSDRAFYFVCVAFLIGVLFVVRRFRRSRSGRLVLAARDNPRAAASVGVNPATARLAAFALSGAIAALGGALLAYQQGSVDAGSYGTRPSMQVFLATVLGGIASPAGAVLGATLLKAVTYFVAPHVRDASLIFEGPLLLAVLFGNPGGISAALVRARDRFVAGGEERRR
jgi:branched-chain amino acid transport system permease protein